MWENLKLTDAEKHEVQVSEVEEQALVRRGNLCLIGLAVSDKSINKEAFKSTILSLWKPKGLVQFREVGDNLFLMEFQVEQDMHKVKIDRPWSFD